MDEKHGEKKSNTCLQLTLPFSKRVHIVEPIYLGSNFLKIIIKKKV
jgi:hypothetical protein